jgi:hypothetical protein
MTEKPGFDSVQEKGCLLFSKAFMLALKSNQPHIKSAPILFLGDKAAGA